MSIETIREALKGEGKHCKCGDIGYTVEPCPRTGEAMQVQCEFCYTTEDSQFNLNQKALVELDQLEQRSTALGRIVGHKPEQQWIPVSERLPEVGEWVVARNRDRWPFTCRWQDVKDDMYNGTACVDADRLLRSPTHWMPLPAPPKESSDD